MNEVTTTTLSPAELERLRAIPSKPPTNSVGLPQKKPIILPQRRRTP